VRGPHWTASFADNDGGAWSDANGGTGDDHGPNTSYGYACCGGTTPPNSRVSLSQISGVNTTFIHDVADTYFSGAAGICASLNSDICTDSQSLALRQGGALSAANWTASHSDNDGGEFSAANGGTSDDTNPSEQYGFACCASNLPQDLSCPVSRSGGVCAISFNNSNTANFAQAAIDCASQGADLCTIAQSAVLRTAGSLTVSRVWTASHSDNDAGNASIAVGSMSDNPGAGTLAGYGCCLK